MAYSTETDITNLEVTKAELVALTDDDKLGEVDSDRVAAAILKADTEIDSYCRTRYTVPFNPVPDEIKFLSATMAAYWLYRRRQRVSESMLDKYTKALARLKAIADGKYSIDGITPIDNGGIGHTIDSTVKHEFTRTKKDSDGAVVGEIGSTETW